MVVTMNAISGAWGMKQLVEGAGGILVDDKAHCKCRNTGGEGDNSVPALAPTMDGEWAQLALRVTFCRADVNGFEDCARMPSEEREGHVGAAGLTEE